MSWGRYHREAINFLYTLYRAQNNSSKIGLQNSQEIFSYNQKRIETIIHFLRPKEIIESILLAKKPPLKLLRADERQESVKC